MKAILLTILSMGLCLGCKHLKENDSAAYVLKESGFSCLNPSWRVGEWKPLTYTPDPNSYAIWSSLPPDIFDDKETFYLSGCINTMDMRIIDPLLQKERIIFSNFMRGENRPHEWIAVLGGPSISLLTKGDAFVILNKRRLHIFRITSISEVAKFKGAIEYEHGVINIKHGIPVIIDWRSVLDQSAKSEESIPVDDRNVRFYVYPIIRDEEVALDTDGSTKWHISIDYDLIYGGGGRVNPHTLNQVVYIAMIDSDYIEANSNLDLSLFRFKCWEDGLGNRCNDVKNIECH